MSYVIPGAAVAVLGGWFLRERRYWEVLIGAMCLIAGASLAIEGAVTINALLH